MGLFRQQSNRFQERFYHQMIEERLTRLEEKVFKTARKDTTTVKQQILILHHLGILEKLNEFNITRDKKAKLLSVLLNGSFDNIRGYLTEINKKKSELKNEFNYDFLYKLFKDSGLKKQEHEVEKILEELSKNDSES